MNLKFTLDIEVRVALSHENITRNDRKVSGYYSEHEGNQEIQ